MTPIAKALQSLLVAVKHGAPPEFKSAFAAEIEAAETALKDAQVKE